MPDIDHAMHSGVPRSEILKILYASGLEMTMRYFDVARRRIKKRSSATSLASEPTLVANNSNANVASSIEKPRANELDSTISSNLNTIKPLIPSNSLGHSAKRFRDQFVDLDTLSQLAPEKKP